MSYNSKKPAVKSSHPDRIKKVNLPISGQVDFFYSHSIVAGGLEDMS